MPLGVTLEQRGVLREFLSMSPEARASFLLALSRLRPSPRATDLAGQLSEEVGVQPGRVQELARLMVELHLALRYEGLSPGDFAARLCEELRSTKDVTPDATPADWATIEASISEVMSIESLAISAAAVDLGGEHERPLCEARIITDLRPIYGSDVSKVPVAALVHHVLRIAYHAADGKHGEFYCVLDSEDLSLLKDSVERAVAKEASLREWLASSAKNTPILSG